MGRRSEKLELPLLGRCWEWLFGWFEAGIVLFGVGLGGGGETVLKRKFVVKVVIFGLPLFENFGGFY